MRKLNIKKSKTIKTLVIILEFLLFFLIFYIIFLPVYPELKYSFNKNNQINSQDISEVITEAENTTGHLPLNEYSVSPDRLIIPKIKVDAPLIATDNEEYGLSKGAWLMPVGSTPDQGGNTVITGHRFRYLPPNNLTFYLFHKLEEGDVFSLIWQGENYVYKIKEIKIVLESDSSPHNKSEESILTMYTCHPIYSTEKRLVVISELISGPDTRNSENSANNE